MTCEPTRRTAPWGCLALLVLAIFRTALAAEDAPVSCEQFLLFQQRHQQMEQHPEKPQALIDSPTRQIAEIHQAKASSGPGEFTLGITGLPTE